MQQDGGEAHGWVHLFTTKFDVIGPSAAIGGHPGGQISFPIAIVEYAVTGRIQEVPASYVTIKR